MNKAELMGRLTKDPELRYTSGNNTAVCTFTLAVNRQYKQDGQPEADFIPVVAWSKLGETCGKYLSKGRRIVIVGHIQTRTWDDNDGKKHYVTEVIAEEMHFADDKKEEGQSGASSSGSPSSRGQQQSPPPAQAQTQPAAGGQSQGTRPPWMR
jgi:single-strand DNA-binding protein